MMVFYHSDERITATDGVTGYDGWKVARALVDAARKHPEELLVWCHRRLKDNLNVEVLQELMHHKRLLYSFNVSGRNHLDPIIGFVEEATPFIAVKRQVKYPTWQMSGHVGIVHASVLLAFEPYLQVKDEFDYFLNSFAKRAMVAGLFCYSEPRLLKGGFPETGWKHAGIFETFRFVRQHYRMRWTSLMLLDMVLFRKKVAVLPYLFSIFHSNRKFNKKALSGIPLESTRNIVARGDIDVMIPTIGRKEHLYNVLKDLAAQTYLPKKVVIVEQNPDTNSVSELDFLTGQTWPFSIEHVFTHRAGACNARNICLSKVQSEFVFMADDDIRFEPTLIENVISCFKKTGNEVIQVSSPQPNEKLEQGEVIQHAVFGSGSAFLKRTVFDGVWFNPGFEYGYGEDKDFGIQLRNKGHDILYAPSLKASHLKAPMGGFRFKPELRWGNEDPMPKPSPTVMLYMIRNMTAEQVKGYKVVHFFKNYGKRGKSNPFAVYRNFQKRWKKSVYWANELAKR